MGGRLIYTDAFFQGQEEGMLRSARLVVPIVVRLIGPSSVLDVGCGRGAWLRAFQEMGVDTIQGLDGEYVERDKLLVPPEYFTPTDLGQPFETQRRYDLAVCLEVAEHLPDASAPVLVEGLVRAAPAILFSAAVPGQGGAAHVNERMPGYWRALFRRYGYAMLDPFRPEILTDTRIEWWYRQNIVLYASEELIGATPALEAYRTPEDALGIEWVHVSLVRRAESIRPLCRKLFAAIGRSLRRRVGSNVAARWGE